MGLVFELASKGFFLLTEVVTGASLHIDEYSGQADPLKVRPVLSVERLAAGSDEATEALGFEPVERCFEIFVVLDGEIVHSERSSQPYRVAY